MQGKRTVSKFNPYEPSVRERLAQRDAALRTQAYAATGKRKYAVSKPLVLAAKREINALYGSNAGYSLNYNQYQYQYRALRSAGRARMIIDYKSWEVVGKVEERWLTERQATMWRLKGYVVDLA